MKTSTVSKVFFLCYVYYLLNISSGCLFFWIIPTNSSGRADGELSVDINKYNLVMQAFDTCEEDGETGLTWAEIEQCEETYCALLTVECPTLEEFTAFDDNQDGILTVQEWMEGNMEAAN